MGITMIKTTNYRNGLIESIKSMMIENNIAIIPLNNTIFEENGNWSAIILEDDKVLIQHRPTEYIKEVWSHDFQHVTTFDLIKLQEVIYDKVCDICLI